MHHIFGLYLFYEPNSVFFRSLPASCASTSVKNPTKSTLSDNELVAIVARSQKSVSVSELEAVIVRLFLRLAGQASVQPECTGQYFTSPKADQTVYNESGTVSKGCACW